MNTYFQLSGKVISLGLQNPISSVCWIHMFGLAQRQFFLRNIHMAGYADLNDGLGLMNVIVHS